MIHNFKACIVGGVLWCLVLQSGVTFGQSSRICYSDSIPAELSALTDAVEKTLHKDTFALYHQVAGLIDSMHAMQYIEAGVDSMVYSDTVTYIYIYAGPRYQARYIIASETAHGAGGDTITCMVNDSLTVQQHIKSLQQKHLQLLTGQGYPFAAAYIKPVVVDTLLIDFLITFDPGIRFTLGGVQVVGDLKVTPFYIRQMINMPVGDPYHPDIVSSVEKRARELPFANQTRSPAVVFAEDKAYLALFLNKKDINRFDLLIGVQPNTSTIPGVSNRLLLTGNATIELINQFGRGERFLAEYFQPSALQQQLKLEGEYPFIFSTPLGLQAGFRLLKFDSTYLEKYTEAGMQYYFTFDSRLKAFWNRASSDLTTINAAQIIASKKLPANLDFKTDFFGLEYARQDLDYRFNPRKGYQVQAKLGVGSRIIYKNDKIIALNDALDPTFDFTALYDTVETNTLLIKPEIDGRVFIPIKKRFTLMIRTNGGLLSGTKTIYNNEKFRIGGIKTFRGWNEQSIFAAGFMVFTTEARMILDDLSAIFVFADQGWINYSNNEFGGFNWNMGLGAGINFGTNIGVFSLSAAIGRTHETHFSVQAAKIHFGYQSLF